MTRRQMVLVAWLAAALLAGSSLALAWPSGGFSLDWFSVGAGGGASAGGSYSVSSDIGRPEAGTLSGGGYTVGGIFRDAGDTLYLPLVTR